MKNTLFKTFICAVLALFMLSETASAQERILIKSVKNLKCTDTVLVFSPKHIAGDIPSLFLLHGWSGCYKDWSNHYDIQAISDRTGFRIICPDGFYDSWYLDDKDASQMQWRKFFHEELYPYMQNKYNLKREMTFITGLSMGGHGAINLYIDDTTKFKSAGSMSGVLDLMHTTLTKSVASKTGGVFENAALESAVVRIRNIAGTNTPLIVTCGYNDYYAQCTYDFCSRCKQLNIPFIQIMSPAKHTWKYWGFALEEHIFLFRKIMEGDNLGY